MNDDVLIEYIQEKGAEVSSNPKHWGRYFWTTLVYIGLNYPNNPTEEDKRIYRNFFESIGYLLPCVKCRYNYKKHSENNPIDLTSRVSLLEWLLKIYNSQEQNSPLTLRQFIAKYLKSPNGNPANELGLNDDDEVHQTGGRKRFGRGFSIFGGGLGFGFGWIFIILFIILFVYFFTKSSKLGSKKGK